ncbi:MAG: MoaD/ThiS family protein [Nitrososphaeria archaeon]|nr:MoaD/ThiS family protein [Conexivisphaerales archaeon]
MARVKLRVFYELIDVLGAHELEVEADTILGLLEMIVKKYGERAKRAMLDNSEQFHEHLLVYINNRYIKREMYSKVQLKDGDLVMIMPPVGGG